MKLDYDDNEDDDEGHCTGRVKVEPSVRPALLGRKKSELSATVHSCRVNSGTDWAGRQAGSSSGREKSKPAKGITSFDKVRPDLLWWLLCAIGQPFPSFIHSFICHWLGLFLLLLQAGSYYCACCVCAGWQSVRRVEGKGKREAKEDIADGPATAAAAG